MRRWLVLAVLFGWLICSGCAEKTVPPITAGFSCAVTVTANGASVAGALSRTGAGQLTFACTAPETLAGFAARVCGEDVTLSYGGLSKTVSKSELPKQAVFLRLCRVLDAAALCVSQSGSVQGVCATEPYTLTYDPASGYLCTLTVPNASFSVVFSDFSAISE